jgi:hypothetical protein
VPPDLFIVVNAVTSEEGPELALEYELDPDRTIIDRTGKISDSLNIKISPAAVIVENGKLVRATTVPSTRQLYALLDSIRTAELVAVEEIPSAARKVTP